MKVLLKRLTPGPFLRAFRARQLRKLREEYGHLSAQDVFTRIYECGAWGKSSDSSVTYFSGSGSHAGPIVTTYLAAVEQFLISFVSKPSVADLGCGDFAIGARIRGLCGNYTACDIVPKLIEINRERFADLDVDFRVLDLTTDELPPAEVVFVRQVLQHLSNEQILRAVPKIQSNYKFLVLTEHLPAFEGFVPNRDHPAGPGVRLGAESGIVITSAPFSLKVKSERVLCEVGEAGGLIRTTLFEL